MVRTRNRQRCSWARLAKRVISKPSLTLGYIPSSTQTLRTQPNSILTETCQARAYQFFNGARIGRTRLYITKLQAMCGLCGASSFLSLNPSPSQILNRFQFYIYPQRNNKVKSSKPSQRGLDPIWPKHPLSQGILISQAAGPNQRPTSFGPDLD